MNSVRSNLMRSLPRFNLTENDQLSQKNVKGKLNFSLLTGSVQMFNLLSEENKTELEGKSAEAIVYSETEIIDPNTQTVNSMKELTVTAAGMRQSSNNINPIN